MEDVSESVTTSLQQLKMERSLSLNNTMNASNGTSPSFRRSQSTHRKSVFVIGVAGGTASGKTTVCDYIMQRLHGMCIHSCLDGHGWMAMEDFIHRGVCMCRSMCCHVVTRLFL